MEKALWADADARDSPGWHIPAHIIDSCQFDAILAGTIREPLESMSRPLEGFSDLLISYNWARHSRD